MCVWGLFWHLALTWVWNVTGSWAGRIAKIVHETRLFAESPTVGKTSKYEGFWLTGFRSRQFNGRKRERARKPFKIVVFYPMFPLTPKKHRRRKCMSFLVHRCHIYKILVKCMALAAHNSTCIYCKHPFAQSLLWSGHWRLHWRHIAGCTEGHVKIGRNCTRLQISSKLASCRWATMTYIGLETCSTSFGKLCLCVTTSRKTLGCMREPLQSIKSFKVSRFLARPSLSRSLDLCWANSSIW